MSPKIVGGARGSCSDVSWYGGRPDSVSFVPVILVPLSYNSNSGVYYVYT